ncbi:type VII secretion protein EsaA, partial [Lactococcus lactis subsp. lactis]|uniref:hypothetical protein n=1 Tax=Lactococcus lactis TaxID=1358 RepID=UPI00223BB980
ANEISEYLGGDKFGDISDLLNQIDETAHQITLFYGAPGDEVVNMIGKLPNPASLDDFKNCSKASIFYLYGNIDIDKRKDKLSDEDVKNYRENGISNINDL